MPQLLGGVSHRRSCCTPLVHGWFLREVACSLFTQHTGNPFRGSINDYDEDPDVAHDGKLAVYFNVVLLNNFPVNNTRRDFINSPFNDDESSPTWEQIQFPGDGIDQTNSTQPASHRVRHYHPNQCKTLPGGANHLQHMDNDEHAHIRNSENVYYPFASQSEWGLASWLSSGSLSQKEIDQYLHSQRVSDLA